jgi:RNA polymerase sigma-70 factor (ECF subfamily)
MTREQPASADQWKRLRTDVGRLVARRVASAADVEDVVQEVLIRVWRQGGRLRHDERFGAWLSRVVTNAVIDQMRSRSSHPLAHDAPTADVAATTGEPPSAHELIAAVLRPFVDQLSPRYREVIKLSELDGWSHASIAGRLSLSVSGVKSRVQRGRRQLRSLLERCCAFALDARGAPMSCAIRPEARLPPGCCASQSNPDGTCEGGGCAPNGDGRAPRGARPS